MAEAALAERPTLKPKDYATDQEVRWCPGCGDYAILKGVQATLARLQADPDNTVFVSGIGCAARFPYYVNTYGFHTIHGRAAAFATGIKLANPELDVWVVSGDGDSLSIGGNHLLHLLRRNVNLQYLLFNNEIYGLTKGQYSPTSRAGTRSPSSPGGSLETPVDAASFALGAGAKFVARTADLAQKHLIEVLLRAHAHRGTSFVEILQNCIVYNDGVFDAVTAKTSAADNQLLLEHGKPMRFGKDGCKGLVLDTRSLKLDVVTVGEGGVPENKLMVHDETNRMLATMLANMTGVHFPEPLGVLYCESSTPLESARDGSWREFANRPRNERTNSLNTLLRSGHAWTVGDA